MTIQGKVFYSMEQEILGFITYLHNVKKTSNNTEMSYKRDLTKFRKYMEEQGVESVDQITATNLNSFILYLEKNGFAAATISRLNLDMGGSTPASTRNIAVDCTSHAL